jgi:hypothetical protein
MSEVPRGPDWWQDEDGRWYPRDVSSSGESSDSPLTSEDVGVEAKNPDEENLPEYFSRTYGWEGASSDDEPILVIDSGNSAADVDPSFTTLTERTRTSVHKPLKLATPPDIFSGILGVIGAAFLIIGSFLDWGKAGGSLTTGFVNGMTHSNGVGTLITGAICALVAGLFLVGQRKRWVGLSMIISAGVALGLSIYSLADIANTSSGIPENLIGRFPNIDVAFANKAKLDFDLGLWVVLGGSVMSFLSGISGFKRHT